MGRACRRDMPCERGNMTYRIRLSDGTIYESADGPPRPRPAARKSVAEAAAIRVGAAVLEEQLKRNEVIKELEAAANRWEQQAATMAAPTSDLKRYYIEKAQNARARAKELRAQ
jgi:hypothetical protein